MAEPLSKRRRIQDNGNPSSQDNKIIQFEEPPTVFTNIPKLINELQSYLTENV